MGRNCTLIGCTYAFDSARCTDGAHCQGTVPSRQLIGAESRCMPPNPQSLPSYSLKFFLALQSTPSHHPNPCLRMKPLSYSDCFPSPPRPDPHPDLIEYKLQQCFDLLRLLPKFRQKPHLFGQLIHLIHFNLSCVTPSCQSFIPRPAHQNH